MGELESILDHLRHWVIWTVIAYLISIGIFIGNMFAIQGADYFQLYAGCNNKSYGRRWHVFILFYFSHYPSVAHILSLHRAHSTDLFIARPRNEIVTRACVSFFTSTLFIVLAIESNITLKTRMCFWKWINSRKKS